MTLFLLGLLQNISGQPDIGFHAKLSAQSVTIEKQGRATLTVHASPDAGSAVKVVAPSAIGSKTLHNVQITVDAEARLRGSEANVGDQNATLATEAEPPR